MLRSSDKKRAIGLNLGKVLPRLQSYDSDVLLDSPLLFLRFSEDSGATCANSGSLGGNATANGTFTRNYPSIAPLGVGISLGGTASDYVSYPDNASLDITGNVTYECWCSITSFASYNTLMSKGKTSTSAGYTFRVDQTTRAFNILKSNTSSLVSGGTYPNDALWHHVAFTRSGNTYVIFLDGVVVSTGTSSTTIDATSEPLVVGADIAGGSISFPLVGRVDEAAVYSTALGSSRIQSHYQSGISFYQSQA